MIYFTSDLHFGHNNILTLGKGRPFKTIEEHDIALINNWNSVVKPGDVVYVLGDFSMSNNIDTLRKYLTQLKGAKHLILGNHDRVKLHAALLKENLWQSIRPYHRIKVKLEDNTPVVISLLHFPILEYDGAFKANYYHLYGHIHNINNYDDIYKQLNFKAMNVGVDVNNFKPVSIEETWKFVNKMVNNE